jgi:patatin-like phospholipase/acyl hydrolase
LDGGGSKGIVTAVLLDALERESGGFVANVDLFAGTSIGAANAAALACGHSTESMVRFYHEQGCNLFRKRYQPSGVLGLITKIFGKVPVLGEWVYKFDNLFVPKWDNSGLDEALRGFFGEQRTIDSLDRKLMLSALQLDGKMPGSDLSVVRPRSIGNYRGLKFGELPVFEAVFRSMSAPVFFESHNGFVDGGMYAVNPCIAAMATAASETGGGVPIDEISVLSVGCGASPSAIEHEGPLAWGLLKWAPRAFDLSSVAVDEFDTLHARNFLGDRFYRLNIPLPRQFALDDCKELPELEEIANAAIETPAFKEAVEFVKRRFGGKTN